MQAMPDRLRRAALWVAVMLTASLPAAGAAGQQARVEVRPQGERWFVQATRVPLGEVLAKLVEAGAITEVVGGDRLTGEVSVDASDQSLIQVFDSLLAGMNYTLEVAPGSAAGAARYRLRISSREPGRAPATGIPLPTIENLLIQDLNEATNIELPEPGDDPDPDADDPAVTLAEQATELADKESVGDFSNERPFARLAEEYESDNPLVRMRALEVMAERYSRQALKPLLEALGDDDGRVGYRVVELLADRTDAESLKQLEDRLKSSVDTSVRLRAFAAIARRGDVRSTPAIEAISKDSNDVIRDAAGEYLAEIARRRRADGR
jgi:hypothetical protein